MIIKEKQYNQTEAFFEIAEDDIVSRYGRGMSANYRKELAGRELDTESAFMDRYDYQRTLLGWLRLCNCEDCLQIIESRSRTNSKVWDELYLQHVMPERYITDEVLDKFLNKLKEAVKC